MSLEQQQPGFSGEAGFHFWTSLFARECCYNLAVGMAHGNLEVPRITSVSTFLAEHDELTRRYFLGLGAAGVAALALLPSRTKADLSSPELRAVLDNLESCLTPQEEFRDVSRGIPVPHTLDEEKKREVGLTGDTWKLEVVGDPDHKPDIRNPLSKETNNAFDFKSLMKLAEKHSVRFPKIMTCNNIGCPLGTGIWEGVPLRHVFWLTEPRRDVRRVFYYGYHNDDPKQMFRSSLPLGRVLEDPFDLPPVILCYKLNGQWLASERGGPVRVVVPEAYGFKSIKWLSHVVITNLSHANDTYAEKNNDIDSWMKTFAATISIPRRVKAGQPIPVTGYAQSGIAGLAKVQVWMHPESKSLPPDDRYYTKAPWTDATILPPPANWGGGLPDGKIPTGTIGYDPKTGNPVKWPMRLAKAHWATLLPGLPAGDYSFRCRTIDQKGNAQPMPRPFDKSGRTSIERVAIKVEG